MPTTRLPVAGMLGALALAAFLVAPIGAARAQDTDTVIARVNGVDIRQSDLTYAEDEIGSNMPAMPPDPGPEKLTESLAADDEKLVPSMVSVVALVGRLAALLVTVGVANVGTVT